MLHAEFAEMILSRRLRNQGAQSSDPEKIEVCDESLALSRVTEGNVGTSGALENVGLLRNRRSFAAREAAMRITHIYRGIIRIPLRETYPGSRILECGALEAEEGDIQEVTEALASL